MIAFLTSSFVEYQVKKKYEPKPIDESNGFGDNLRRYWKEKTRFLVFASDPANPDMTDHVTREMYESFTLSGFDIAEIKYFDNRSIGESDPMEVLREYLSWADVLYLSGGHAPTENAFMKRCRLKELLSEGFFDGILIALSAGMVNCAEQVYLIPELEGEAVDPNFVKYTDGLGITNINTLPHAQFFRGETLDGFDIIGDIIAGDSYDRDIYLINDGSYFMLKDKVTEFFGEGEIVSRGKFSRLNSGIINFDNKRYRKSNPDSIYEWNRLAEVLMEGAYDFVFILDLERESFEFLRVSRFFLKKGLTPVNIDSLDDLNHLIAEKLIVEEESQAFLDQIELPVVLDEVEKTGSYVRTIHLHTDDGIRAENYRIKPLGLNSRVLMGCLTDIQLILDHDWMTDVYSRTGFIERAEEIIAGLDLSEGYGLIYTNIQGFKAINDMLGNFCGDMIIFQERDLLLRCFKPLLLARFESEHYVAIVKKEYITKENLDELSNQSYDKDSKRYHFAVRCGIYYIKSKDKKIQRLIDKAKLAENFIPADRKEAYAVYDEKIMEEYLEQGNMLSDLDRALKNEEFRAYFQPVVDARSGEIVSAEALIRWKHHHKGMISPGQFVPVFEKNGVITKIDNFMVNSVMDFNTGRLAEGKKIVPVAVNLSRVDFYDTRLLDALENNLCRTDRVADMIKLEVTESAYAVLEKDAIEFLNRMRELKLPLLLDDFGSGMSSLSTLQGFEFDIIKLDMGFIRMIGISRKTEAIIKYIIDLSHALGAKVVAEGVETKAQLEYLQECDCDMIQGYYFYKPMPAEEFADILDR